MCVGEFTLCFWMSAEPEGQYFHTAILQKAAPIQKLIAFQSLRGTHHRRLESFYWSGQRESNPHLQPGRLR